jgi:hypothetical protein
MTDEEHDLVHVSLTEPGIRHGLLPQRVSVGGRGRAMVGRRHRWPRVGLRLGAPEARAERRSGYGVRRRWPGPSDGRAAGHRPGTPEAGLSDS